MDLTRGLLNGDKRAVARLITLAENENPEAIETIKLLYNKVGKAHIIGITGPPGSGKSTLADKLAKELRKKGKTVGIIAVDPTSPFTGGAILGDRIRMQDLSLDEGVFIRSMGTRGHLGGISKATHSAVKILDIYGMDYIFIETVGVGQSEVDIVKTADTTVLVMVPGLGDDIQAIKAGIMEIGDIFVINKADRGGAEKLMTEIEMMLDLSPHNDTWRPPVLKAIATESEGIEGIIEKLETHYEFLKNGPHLKARRQQRIKNEILDFTKQHLMEMILSEAEKSLPLDELAEQVYDKKIDPYSASFKMINLLKKKGE